jgi:hypothetical protein
MKNNVTKWFSLVFLALFALATIAAAQSNLLTNPSFELVGPSGPSTTLNGAGATGWYSAADSWYTWENPAGTIQTDLVASTDPNGGTRMLHVYTTCDSCGIFQMSGPSNQGPAQVNFSVDVYVVQGCVGFGAGNGGNTYITASTCVHNRWITLKGRNGVSPVNEFIVYSYRGPAEWYVDAASVTVKTNSSANTEQ